MLTTGVRTPVGIKVFGHDLEVDRGRRRAARVDPAARCRARAAFSTSARSAEPTSTWCPNAKRIARFGLQVGELNAIIERAIGGEPITTTVEGRERYTVNVRYKEDFRSSPEKLRQVLVPLPSRIPGDMEGNHIPLGELADVKVVEGPPMLRDEAGLLVGYVYVDLEPWRDIGGYVNDAKAAVAARAGEPGAQARYGHVHEMDGPVRAAREHARADEDS